MKKFLWRLTLILVVPTTLFVAILVAIIGAAVFILSGINTLPPERIINSVVDFYKDKV